MSGMDHTPEPWVYRKGDSVVWTSDRHQIAMVEGGDPAQDDWLERREANARRIVACANACAGIDTDKLEFMGLQSVAFLCGTSAKLANEYGDEAQDLRTQVARQAATIERLRAALGHWLACRDALTVAHDTAGYDARVRAVIEAQDQLAAAAEAARAALAETEVTA